MRQQQKVLSFGWILLCAWLTVPAYAAPQPKVQSLPNKIASDQLLTLRIDLEWPSEEGVYEIHPSEPQADHLSLIRQYQSQETGAVMRHILFYDFQPLTRGSAKIYSFEIRYRRSNTDAWSTLQIPEQHIEITQAFPMKLWLMISGSIAGLIILIGVGWQVLKKIKRKAELKNASPPDPKQERYLEAQNAISCFSSRDPKEKLRCWSAEFKKVVRVYYDIPPQNTSDNEILTFLKNKNLSHAELNEISRLFDQLARLKFSSWELSAQETAFMQKTLLKYVRGKIIIGNSDA